MNKLKFIIYILICLFTSFFIFLIQYMLLSWPNVGIDEILFHLDEPLAETSSALIIDFIIKCMLPTVITLIISMFIFKFKIIKFLLIPLLIFALGFQIYRFCINYKIDDFIAYNGEVSNFIEENYVDPKNVKIKFPEKKRNLIYIFLESMEMSYADKKNGGGYDVNLIPDLTKIAFENEYFGSANKLNGALVMHGSGFTTGAVVSHVLGFPISGSGNRSLFTKKATFKNAIGLGDILKNEGYENILLLGSNSSFGGINEIFGTHGEYEIRDYNYAIKNGFIPKDYKVNWGFEDKKLFELAKKELNNISLTNKPFNLTIMTIDSHVPGFVDDDCQSKFSEIYENSIYCSSILISEFVEWVKSQDFYENTTIILVGDHTSMNDIMKNVNKKFKRRVFVSFINSMVNRQLNTQRLYSTLDMLPTTLASLGATIEGDRLGLGTNLFSDKSTILEEKGLEFVSTELKKRSNFYEKLDDWDLYDRERILALGITTDIKTNDNNLSITVGGMYNFDADIKDVEATIYDKNNTIIERQTLKLQPDRDLFANFSDIDLKNISLEISILDNNRTSHIFYSNHDLLENKDNPRLNTYSLDIITKLNNNELNITLINSDDVIMRTLIKDVFVYIWNGNTPTDTNKYLLKRIKHDGKTAFEIKNLDISNLNKKDIYIEANIVHLSGMIIRKKFHLNL